LSALAGRGILGRHPSGVMGLHMRTSIGITAIRFDPDTGQIGVAGIAAWTWPVGTPGTYWIAMADDGWPIMRTRTTGFRENTFERFYYTHLDIFPLETSISAELRVGRSARSSVVQLHLDPLAPDTLERAGSAHAEAVLAGAQDDTLSGAGGNDLLAGWRGNDLISGEDGRDVLQGDDGDDTLSGGRSDDTLHGGSGADALSGGSGADLLTGGGGADRLAGGEGADTLASGSLDPAEGGEGGDSIFGAGGDDLLLGSAGADRLSGGEGNDLLRGGPDGGAGGDTLLGGAGQDTLLGGGGADSLVGGAGDDVIAADRALAPVPGQGRDDTLMGGEGNDRLEGGTGDDALGGGGGADTLHGDAAEGAPPMPEGGADSLHGSSGADLLVGGAGADTLAGGLGADTIESGIGGDGDLILFAGRGEGGDVIHGFDPGLDRILVLPLRDLDAERVAIGAGPMGPGTWLRYDPGSGELWADTDGNGRAAPVHLATLLGAPTLGVDDLLPG
jgi:Ca2+-binding RTX toxin-like protein